MSTATETETTETQRLDDLLLDKLDITVELAGIREKLTSIRMQLSERADEKGSSWWHSARAAMRSLVEDKAELERELTGIEQIEKARRLELNAIKQRAHSRGKAKTTRIQGHVRRLEAYQGALHRAIRKRFGVEVLRELQDIAKLARDQPLSTKE